MNRLRRLLNSPRITTNLIVGIVILSLVILVSVVGPLFVNMELTEVGATPPANAPSAEYLLGTDSQGRDLLAVLISAIPQTLKMGLIAGIVGVSVGLLLGLISGFFGGPLDTVIRIFADSLMTVPGIAILLVIASNIESMTIEVMALTVAALAWMYPTRTIRSQVLSIRERPYMAVARANGESELEVLFREVMPNLVPYVTASLVASINGAILATVGLESLGLGAQNVHTLGTTIYWARRYSAVLRGQWWWWAPPIFVVSLIFIGLFLVSMGLDRFANPTLSNKASALARRLRKKGARGDDPISNAASTVAGSNVEPDLLRVENLRVVFDTNAGTGVAVEDISFTMKPGERMGLVGESGCGKTTMATAILSLVRPPGRIAGGRVRLGDIDLLSLSDEELRKMRLKEIALVPQAAMNSLNPVMRIGEQLADAIRVHKENISQNELDAMIEESLTKVGLAAAVANRYPHQLSGGMKQRISIAIATVLGPQLIIADEPTSALDVVVQQRVMQTLGRVQKELGAAMVLIGHDMGLIAQFSDSIGVLYAGKMVERGDIDTVLNEPCHPYTRLLIDSLPKLEIESEFVGIPGLPPALFDRPGGCYFHPRCPFAFDRCQVETPEPQLVNGREVACHLYPEHAKLPPVPLASVVVAGDGALPPGISENVAKDGSTLDGTQKTSPTSVEAKS